MGLPAGVFNLVTGTGPVVGEALVSHPETDMVSFTAPRGPPRLRARGAGAEAGALELGGKSPNVILDDADLEQAVTDGVAKCFLNSGQTCSALTRMLVPRDKLEQAERIAATSPRAPSPPATPSRRAARSGRSSPRRSASACAATSRRASRRARAS